MDEGDSCVRKMEASTAHPKEIDGSLLRRTSPIVSGKRHLFLFDRGILLGEFSIVVGIRTLNSSHQISDFTPEVQEKEIRLLGSLSHRNILPVFGCVHSSLVGSIRLITELPAFGLLSDFVKGIVGPIVLHIEYPSE